MMKDGQLTFEEAIRGSDAPKEITETLSIIEVSYYTFDSERKTGQLIVHCDLAEEVQEMFTILAQEQFPIHKVVPVVAYGWDDEASMADNNTSAFNYREIIGTNHISNHSLGRAIDINPLLNPYFARDGKVYPQNATYHPDIPGTLTAKSIPVQVFKKYGWTWLGERKENTDYQHFEKPLS